MLIASFARRKQQVLYRHSFARLRREQTSFQPFQGSNQCAQKRQVALAGTATVDVDEKNDCTDSHNTLQVTRLASFHGGPSASPTFKIRASRHALGSYIRRLRRLKETTGRSGIIELWKELKGQNIDIKPTSIYGRELWQDFLQVGLEDRHTLEELWKYALDYKERTGGFYLALYETVVPWFLLKGHPQLAYDWHRTIKAGHPIPERSFLCLMKQLAFNIVPLSHASNDILELIYKDSDDRNVYDYIVPSTCEHGNHKRAFRWHKLLLMNNDFPSPEVATNPQVMAMLKDRIVSNSKHMVPEDSTDVVESSLNLSQDYTAPGPTLSTVQHEEPVSDHRQGDMTREAMNRHLGEVHGISEKRINDDFCARLFATRIFPVNVVISGLGLIGVHALGPIALRELAVRALSRTEFLENLEALNEAKILIKPCVYSNLILRAAYEESDELFDSVVNTDQHPEVFEDLGLQQKLLDSYIAAKDWIQAHRTLMIIAMLDPIQSLQTSPVSTAWNFVLSSNTAQARHPSVATLLNQLLVNRIPTDDSALKSISQKYLKGYLSRRPDLYIGAGRRLEVVDPADLSLVLTVFLRAQRTTRPIPPHIWRGIMQRLGMQGRYQELARISLWLTTTYSSASADQRLMKSQPGVLAPPVSGASTSSEQAVEANSSRHPDEFAVTVPPSRPNKNVGPLDTIFSINTQYSIVAWGILGLLSRRETHIVKKPADWFSTDRYPACELWACGIKLLKILQEQGAPIYTDSVREIVQDRLWMLFGTMNFTRWENRVASERNPHSLAHMINHVNDDVWPGLFDYVAPFLLDEGPEWSEDLFHTVFRRQLLKREGFWERAGKHRMLKWGTPYKTYRKRLETRPKLRRLLSIKGLKLSKSRYGRRTHL